MIKPRRLLPLLNKAPRAGQRGAALIAAIFVITALAALGGVMTQFLTLGSKQTIDEWYSTQALYAAESGVQWAIWDLTVNGGSGTLSNGTVTSNQAWMTTTVSTLTVNGTNKLYTITSTGTAGGTAASPRAQRQIVVQYMP